MELRQFVSDEDAVSPVIGVILMVAITVILAAVIGAFVLGFGGGGPSAPSVTWDTTLNSTDDPVFEHSGGDTIESPNEVLSISSGDDTGVGWTSSSEMTTGSTFGYNETAGSLDDEYTLIWSPQDGDSTQELATFNP